ncbi:hypothetical protein C8F01DRAFT_1258578 [Mycena amicta]|nr:hypothetical protein C8F01DRAFT_1258578 [Mycena amicta]
MASGIRRSNRNPNAKQTAAPFHYEDPPKPSLSSDPIIPYGVLSLKNLLLVPPPQIRHVYQGNPGGGRNSAYVQDDDVPAPQQSPVDLLPSAGSLHGLFRGKLFPGDPRSPLSDSDSDSDDGIDGRLPPQNHRQLRHEEPSPVDLSPKRSPSPVDLSPSRSPSPVQRPDSDDGEDQEDESDTHEYDDHDPAPPAFSDGNDSEDDPDFIQVRREEALADLEYNEQYGVRNTDKVRAIHDEELEAYDYAEFQKQALPEASGLRKRRRKAEEEEDSGSYSAATGQRRKSRSNTAVDEEEEQRPLFPDDPFDEDEDEEEEDPDEQSGSTRKIKRGRPLNAILREVDDLTDKYLRDVDAIGETHGYKVSTLAIRGGVMSWIGRDTSGWNGFQHHFRQVHPKTENMTMKDWRDACVEAYKAKLDELGEDREDPEARRALLQPYIDDYLLACLAASENEKRKKHGSVTLMRTAIRPLVAQSNSLSRSQGLLVVGLCADLSQGDSLNKNVLLWGGGEVYEEAKARYYQEMNKGMGDVYSVLKRTENELRLEASGEAPQRNLVDLDIRKPREPWRDLYRRHIIAMTLNLIYLALHARNDTPLSKLRQLVLKVHWKNFPDLAVQHRLHFVMWPVDFKGKYPGGGKKVQTKDKGSDSEEDEDEDMPAAAASGGISETEALRKMFEAMRNVYRLWQGDEELPNTESADLAPFVESWTADEMALDDPSEVPIVVCADDTVLLRAGASTKLLKGLEKAKAKGKAKSKSTTKKTAPKKTNAIATSSGTTTTPGPPKRSTDEDEEDEEDEDKPPAKRPKFDYTEIAHLTCRYFNSKGSYSTSFPAEGVVQFDLDDESVAERHCYTEFCIKKEWRRMEGFKPVMTKAQRQLARIVLDDIVIG